MSRGGTAYARPHFILNDGFSAVRIASGWLMALLSFPINLIAGAFGCAAALHFPRTIRSG